MRAKSGRSLREFPRARSSQRLRLHQASRGSRRRRPNYPLPNRDSSRDRDSRVVFQSLRVQLNEYGGPCIAHAFFRGRMGEIKRLPASWKDASFAVAAALAWLSASFLSCPQVSVQFISKAGVEITAAIPSLGSIMVSIVNDRRDLSGKNTKAGKLGISARGTAVICPIAQTPIKVTTRTGRSIESSPLAWPVRMFAHE